MLLTFLYALISVLLILLSVAYLTLVERHVLGGSQMRTSVSKVSFMGFVQPILDAVKLLTKNQVYPQSHMMFYNLSPFLIFTLMLFEFCGLDKEELCDFMEFGLLYILVIIGFMSYGVIIGGIVSSSKYAYIGGVRNVLQVISYEVIFTLLLYLLCQSKKSMEVPTQMESMLFFWPFFILWSMIILVELSRTPFDFSEGESELVSGFNIEFSGYNFVFFFLAEYGNILFFSFLTSSLFFNFNMFGTIFMVYLIIILRATLPRFRIDFLMRLTWLKQLSIVLVGYLVSLFYIF